MWLMTWPLLIFDLDGTLIDSAEDIANALNKTLRFYNKPTLPYDVIVAHIGEGLRQLLADFFSGAQGQSPRAIPPDSGALPQHLRRRDVQNHEAFSRCHRFPQ